LPAKRGQGFGRSRAKKTRKIGASSSIGKGKGRTGGGVIWETRAFGRNTILIFRSGQLAFEGNSMLKTLSRSDGPRAARSLESLEKFCKNESTVSKKKKNNKLTRGHTGAARFKKKTRSEKWAGNGRRDLKKGHIKSPGGTEKSEL